MNIDFPIHFDHRHRTAETAYDEHVRDLVEQLLLSNPGERVNRPTWGSGLLQLAFAPNSVALAGATQATVAANLQQWLGDVIEVQTVAVNAVDATLEITVDYVVRRTNTRRVDTFARRP